MKPRYLGDGCTVRFQMDALWLTTDDGVKVDNEICIEMFDAALREIPASEAVMPQSDRMVELERTLNDYVLAELDYRSQTGLDGMDNGGPRGPKAATLRRRVLAMFQAAHDQSATIGWKGREEIAEAIRAAWDADEHWDYDRLAPIAAKVVCERGLVGVVVAEGKFSSEFNSVKCDDGTVVDIYRQYQEVREELAPLDGQRVRVIVLPLSAALLGSGGEGADTCHCSHRRDDHHDWSGKCSFECACLRFSRDQRGAERPQSASHNGTE